MRCGWQRWPTRRRRSCSSSCRPTCRRRRCRRGSGRGAGATATEELHAPLDPSKRVQLEQRRVELVLRDDEHDGAPKRTGIDLAGGWAVIRRPGDG
ncbi:DUF6191 domain-containing protein [Kitasatospora sp. NPDC004669]|uniref:DUF6191 domain-containing protein n=1 Tax=Kitasatospora sp. NPDC004669 TaxID=3154555 RepID=UPI0033A2F906